jgi:hypothetical protein
MAITTNVYVQSALQAIRDALRSNLGTYLDEWISDTGLAITKPESENILATREMAQGGPGGEPFRSPSLFVFRAGDAGHTNTPTREDKVVVPIIVVIWYSDGGIEDDDTAGLTADEVLDAIIEHYVEAVGLCVVREASTPGAAFVARVKATGTGKIDSTTRQGQVRLAVKFRRRMGPS